MATLQLVLISWCFITAAMAKPTGIVDEEYDISVGGEIRLRYEQSDNYDFSSAKADSKEFIGMRNRLDLRFRNGGLFEGFLQPQYSSYAGMPIVEKITDPTTTQTTTKITTTSGGQTDNPLSLHQGYLVLKPIESLSFKGGRQELVYGDHLLIGNGGWSNVGRSFDGAKITLAGSKMKTDLFYTKLIDRNISIDGKGGDQDFFGLYGSMTYIPSVAEFDLYALYYSDRIPTGTFPDPTTPLPNYDFAVLGLRAKSTLGSFFYRFESAFEIGTKDDKDMSEYVVDVEAGVSMKAIFESQLSMEFAKASAQFHQLFPTAHKWLGFMDLFYRRNIADVLLSYSTKPLPLLNLKLDCHNFLRTSTKDPLYNFAGNPYGGSTPARDSYAGTELDLTLTSPLSPAFSIAGGISGFFASSYFKDNIGKDLPVFFYLQTEFKI